MYKLRYERTVKVLSLGKRQVEDYKNSGLLLNQYGNIMSDLSRLMKVGDMQSISAASVQLPTNSSLGRTDEEKCAFVKSRYCDLPKEQLEYEDEMLERFAHSLPSDTSPSDAEGSDGDSLDVSSSSNS